MQTPFTERESHCVFLSHLVGRSSPSSDRRQKNNGDLILVHYNEIFWDSRVLFFGTHDCLIAPTTDCSECTVFPYSGDLLNFTGL